MNSKSTSRSQGSRPTAVMLRHIAVLLGLGAEHISGNCALRSIDRRDRDGTGHLAVESRAGSMRCPLGCSLVPDSFCDLACRQDVAATLMLRPKEGLHGNCDEGFG